MRPSVLYSRQGNYLKNVLPSGTTFIPPIPFGPSVGEDLGGENTLAGRLQFEVDLSDRFHARLTGTAARLRLGTAPYSSRGLQPVFNASGHNIDTIALPIGTPDGLGFIAPSPTSSQTGRSEEHPSEPQSLMRISYAVFCFKNKQTQSRT